MPRIPRGEFAGYCYHVLNRGNGRARVFHTDADYRAFIQLLALAKHRFAVSVLAFCLMPNHFHVVLQPPDNSVLSRFMQWWLTAHVRRHHRRHRTSGHLWQGRFKSFPIQGDEHLLTVIHYVLRNPVRAGLVDHHGEWPWSSTHFPEATDPWPLPRPSDWEEQLARAEPTAGLAALRRSVSRQTPFGDPQWQFHVANSAGLGSSLRPLGRPRKTRKT